MPAALPTPPSPAAGGPPAAAAPTPPLHSRRRVPAAHFDRLAAGPVLCPLIDQSVLEFDGPDAVSFLQGQTTADIAALGAASWQLGGYCTPKGRLLAIFHAWRYENGVRLLLPTAIAAGLARRLAMYVLRAKVRVRDVTADWQIYALLDRDAARGARALGSAVGVAPAQAPWQATAFGADTQARLATLPGGAASAGRWLALLPGAQGGDGAPALAALPQGGPELFWWSQVDAAVPAVFAETSELFVPQTVNLEVLGGVNFRKGCYPGQEIVARSQYLGKLRRRLGLAHAADLGSGGDVYQDGKADPAGRIVLATTAPAGGWDLLFECPVDALQDGAALRAGAPDAPPLQVRPLPYALFDPTA